MYIYYYNTYLYFMFVIFYNNNCHYLNNKYCIHPIILSYSEVNKKIFFK